MFSCFRSAFQGWKTRSLSVQHNYTRRKRQAISFSSTRTPFSGEKDRERAASRLRKVSQCLAGGDNFSRRKTWPTFIYDAFTVALWSGARRCAYKQTATMGRLWNTAEIKTRWQKNASSRAPWQIHTIHTRIHSNHDHKPKDRLRRALIESPPGTRHRWRRKRRRLVTGYRWVVTRRRVCSRVNHASICPSCLEGH